MPSKNDRMIPKPKKIIPPKLSGNTSTVGNQGIVDDVWSGTKKGARGVKNAYVATSNAVTGALGDATKAVTDTLGDIANDVTSPFSSKVTGIANIPTGSVLKTVANPNGSKTITYWDGTTYTQPAPNVVSPGNVSSSTNTQAAPQFVSPTSASGGAVLLPTVPGTSSPGSDDGEDGEGAGNTDSTKPKLDNDSNGNNGSGNSSSGSTQAELDYAAAASKYANADDDGDNILNKDEVPLTASSITSDAATIAAGMIEPEVSPENKKIIQDAFQQFVGRTADNDDLRIHGAALAAGKSVDQFRSEIAAAPESAGYRTKLVDDVFKQYVGRPADSDDQAIHGSALASGKTVDQFRAEIAAAPESQGYRTKIIDDVFKQYVGRPADSDDQAIHSSALAAGKSIDQFRLEIANAPEAVQFQATTAANLAAGERNKYNSLVDGLFQQYVGRAADANDLRIHTSGLVSGTVSQGQLRDQLAAAPESAGYRNKVIEDTFKQYVGRSADSDDQRIHGTALAAGSKNVTQFQSEIMAAPEAVAYRDSR